MTTRVEANAFTPSSLTLSYNGKVPLDFSNIRRARRYSSNLSTMFRYLILIAVICASPLLSQTYHPFSVDVFFSPRGGCTEAIILNAAVERWF